MFHLDTGINSSFSTFKNGQYNLTASYFSVYLISQKLIIYEFTFSCTAEIKTKIIIVFCTLWETSVKDSQHIVK